MYYKLLIAVAGSVLIGACASGTQVSSGGDVTPATPANRNSLPPGTTMAARLDQSISTSSHDGDSFSATVAEPVQAQDGTIAIPAGSVLRGHVTGAHAAKIPGEQNVIRLAFDDIRIAGRTHPFSGSISNVTIQTEGGNTTTRDAATGAAAGAVLGAILSGGEVSKIIAGGLLGAATGTVISMGSGSSAAVIPAGSTVTVRATEAVQIR
jgi:hypothetical protein